MSRSLYLGLLLVPFFASSLFADEKDPFWSKRKKMVEEQIMRRGISDKGVLEAMGTVERHRFVARQQEKFAYEDYPLPIGHGQTISQPYIVAYMTEAAQLKGDDKVLEIGTGSGYQAAMLCEIAKEVYSIEIVKPLADSANELLKKLGYDNIYVKHGDGYAGWPQHAPFDVIIVTAAPPEIPQKLVEQLKVGGRMVIPVGSFFQELYLVTKTKSGVEKKQLLPVRFVPMVKGKDK